MLDFSEVVFFSVFFLILMTIDIHVNNIFLGEVGDPLVQFLWRGGDWCFSEGVSGVQKWGAQKFRGKTHEPPHT